MILALAAAALDALCRRYRVDASQLGGFRLLFSPGNGWYAITELTVGTYFGDPPARLDT